MIVRPLRDLLKRYDKIFIKEWPAEATSAFNTVSEAIGHGPSLFFVSDTGRIVLQADASDYGIGAYLYQVIDGKERPSNGIHKSSITWTVIEWVGT